MNAYTHRRALAAAARLALATVAMDGCDKDRAEPQTPAPEPEAARTHAYGKGERVADAREPAPAERSEPAETAPVDPLRACMGRVDEAFPKPSDYPGEKRSVGIAVKACCADLLVAGTFAGEHRWDCCANLPDGMPEKDAQAANMACTPWGPPVPPAMRVRTEVA